MAAQGGDGSPGTGSEGLDPSLVLAQLANAVQALAASASSSGNRSWTESKYVRSPDVFNPKSTDEEQSLWPEWSFTFKQWMAIQSEEFTADFEKAEQADDIVAFEAYSPEIRARSVRLYAVLSTYLRGRPLRILRSVKQNDGYRVWRMLKDELQPSSRPRALALAQALVKFPPYREGGSLLDYTLAYERLILEYEKLSPYPYDDNLKISTLMSGLPADVRKYLELNLDDGATYEKMRARLLQFERTTAGWSSEHILRSVGIDKDASKFIDTGGPVPMDVDRIENKGAKKGRDAKSKGKGKYEDKGKGKGYNRDWGKGGGKGGKPWDNQYNKHWEHFDHKGKGKGKEKGKKGKGKGYGSGKVGPCYSCGKMGHIAADCRLRNVNQVVGSNEFEASSQVPSSTSVSATSSTNTRVPSLPSAKQPSTGSLRRLSVVNEPINELCIYTPPHSPVCEFFDLCREDEEWSGDDFAAEVRVVSESLGDDVEAELRTTSTLVFDLTLEDDLECCPLGSADYLGDDWDLHVQHVVRTVRESDDAPYEQVILDSGADVTVVPFRLHGVGHETVNNMSIRDAQGHNIPMASQRENVIFEVESSSGERLFFRDKVVVAQVKQPLLCVGKLMREQWLPSKTEEGTWLMKRGAQSFPIHWSRNSMAAQMKIYRLEKQEGLVRMVVEIPLDLDKQSKAAGWQMSPDHVPMHIQLAGDETVDPSDSFPSRYWPFRTTLLQREGRNYSVFESGEYWQDRPAIKIHEPKCKIITLLSLNPVDPETLGKVVTAEGYHTEGVFAGGDEPMSGSPSGPSQEQPLPQALPGRDLEEDVQNHGGDRDVDLGEQGATRATLMVNEKEVSEESTLRELRAACKYLRVSHHGKKAVLWGRLQTEVVDAQAKAAVQASEAVLEAYRRDPDVEKRNERPDDEAVALHEVTHLPRQPWCEACVMSRSREDTHGVSSSKEHGVIHMDFMFNRTEAGPDSENPMAVHLVAVDEQTNFTLCAAVQSKASEHLRTAVGDIVKMAAMLGHQNVTLRGDSEPAMRACLQMVVEARSRLGNATKVEYAVPQGSLHQGLKAERFIGIVRNMGKCLLATVEQKTGFKVKSSHPLYQWCFVHGAFLYTRFHVQPSGQTPFELALGRGYTGKLCAFGSAVYAQIVPFKKSKGESWEKYIFLGKSAMGNLNMVANSQGVHQARTMRKGALTFEAELIVRMKGVPWDTQLDVVVSKKRGFQRLRVPDLIAPQALVDGDHQDEAASDPESSQEGPPNPGLLHPGGLHGSPQGSPNQSTSGSLMSAVSEPELLPDVSMQAISQVLGVIHETDQEDDQFVSYSVREVRDDRPHGHEQEEVPQLEDEFELPEPYAENEHNSMEISEQGNEEVPWRSRSYEDGPPPLGPEELAALDQSMDRVEIKRLLSMNVLKRIPEGGNVDGMKKLNSKNVRDWRFRGNVWVRRSRLVAKEFRFLEPELGDLYAPASMAVLQRVLAGLCVSSKSLVL